MRESKEQVFVVGNALQEDEIEHVTRIVVHEQDKHLVVATKTIIVVAVIAIYLKAYVKVSGLEMNHDKNSIIDLRAREDILRVILVNIYDMEEAGIVTNKEVVVVVVQNDTIAHAIMLESGIEAMVSSDVDVIYRKVIENLIDCKHDEDYVEMDDLVTVAERVYHSAIDEQHDVTNVDVVLVVMADDPLL